MQNFDTISSTSDIDNLYDQIMAEEGDAGIDTGVKNGKITDSVAILNWE